MENNIKSKFRFTSHKKLNKEDRTDLKEKENFNIDELKKYYTDFKAKSHVIEENLKAFDLKLAERSKDENLKELELTENFIKELKEDYNNNASFLVGYDKQNYMIMLEDLNKSFEERKEKINPKKKFTFSNKSNIIKTSSNKCEVELISNKQNIIDESNDFVIKDRTNLFKLIVTKEEVDKKNNLILENISNSQIYILHNFKACYMKNISNSKIFVGSVSGGTHITNCTDSIIYLPTHQLRIHQTSNTNFKIISHSNPIVEDCKGLIFSPLNISYSSFRDNLEKSNIDQEKNKWNSVLDFKWHKKEKSPNFVYGEQSDKIDIDFI